MACRASTGNRPIGRVLIRTTASVTGRLCLNTIMSHDSHHIIFVTSARNNIRVRGITRRAPRLVRGITLSPLANPVPCRKHRLTFGLNLRNGLIRRFAGVFVNLTAVFLRHSLTLVRVGPLIVAGRNSLVYLSNGLNTSNGTLFHRPSLHRVHSRSRRSPHRTRTTR